MGRWAYTVLRVLFGAWFLASGIEYFLPFNLQPLGGTARAQEFTLALIHSGLFAWVKVAEVAIGLAVLANRAILPAALLCLPLTVVIGWWNFVLDPGAIQCSFGVFTAGCNAMLLWPFRRELLALVRWSPVPA
ncbi:MAG: hypothetical protein RIS94_3605 [Pseudomonadota bacterium]|jgi:uncharacterized membrane protein YphA (DoxX/SURF4 family)